MLPNYPRFKNECLRLLNERMQRRMRAAQGLSSQAARHRAFEGSEIAVEPAGMPRGSRPYQEISATSVLPLADLGRITLRDLFVIMDKAADDLLRLQDKQLVSLMDEVTEETGQVLHGAPLSGTTVLEAMRMMPLEIGPDGQPRLTLIVHPSQAAVAAEALRALEESPELRQRYAELIEEKKEEQRVREAARNLAG